MKTHTLLDDESVKATTVPTAVIEWAKRQLNARNGNATLALAGEQTRCANKTAPYHLGPSDCRYNWEGSDLCWSCWREAFKAWTPSVVSPLASSFAFFSRLGLH